jgi:tetratricopeptide (TPR) repeat protein
VYVYVNVTFGPLPLVLLCVASAFPVAAAPSATALAKEADRLYKAGNYAEAAAKLESAYAQEPTAVFLYNMARAYDQAGEERLALENYRKYVAQPSKETQPELLKRANLNMDRLRISVANQEAADKLREAERQRLADEAAQAKQRAEAEAAKGAAEREAFQARENQRVDSALQSRTRRKTIAFVSGGVAVAAAGTGLVFALLSNGSRQQFSGAQTLADKQRLESTTKTQALVADIGFVTAIAAAVTAVIVFPKGTAEPAPVSLDVVPSAGGATVLIGGSF